MRALIARLMAAASLLSLATAAPAASLQVSPVLVEVPAPAKTTILKLKNLAETPLSAQVRVYKWIQQDGADKLVESKDVVASPPIATVRPNGDYVVRLVRLSNAPVQDEESYRLLIDEIPEKSKKKGVSVSFAFRYSVPVFFGPAGETQPALRLSLETHKGKRVLAARNDGTRRIRLANVKITDSAGKPVYQAGGLLGYVLAGATARWPLKNAKGIAEGSTLSLSALTEDGTLQTTIPVGAVQ